MLSITMPDILFDDWKNSPLWKLLTEKLGSNVTNGTLPCVTDSSHGDCSEERLTASHFGFFQDSLVSVSSFVPQPIPHSAAESETVGIGTGVLACAHTQKAVANSSFSNPNKPWTVPFLSDGQTTIAMNNSNRLTKRNKHVDKHCFFGRQESLAKQMCMCRCLSLHAGCCDKESVM